MNMFTKNFVMNIVVDGKILPDTKNGVLALPFGAEYSIRIKNKNTKRACCKISIDGENISGNGWVIDSGATIEIERPLNVARKFTFASITSAAAQEDGKNAHEERYEHGLIEAQFALEKDYSQYVTPYIVPYVMPWHPCNPYKKYYQPTFAPNTGEWCDLSKITGQLGAYNATYSCSGGSSQASGCVSVNNMSLSSTGDLGNYLAQSEPNLSAGVTVEGAKSDQTFSSVYFQDDGLWTTLRIKLRGYNPNANFVPSLTITTGGAISASVSGVKTQSEEDKKIEELKKQVEKLREIEKLEAEINKLKKSLSV